MQIGALNRRMRAGVVLFTALAFAQVQAAPQSRADTNATDTSAEADDNADSTAADAAAANTATATLQNHAGTAKAAPAPATPALQSRDMGSSIREVSKPILEELAHSDVAEAVRALDGNKNSNGDAALEERNQAENSTDPGGRRRNWDGSGQRQAGENNVQQQASNRDPEREKTRAAMLLSSLIDEIKPWAIGAAVLYVLAYIAKFSLAARRRTVQRRLQRRMQRRKHRQHHAGSSNSQNGQP